MDQSDLCTLGHVTNFFKFDKQNCVAHYRDPALTIPVNSSEYSIATYYADFRGRSKSEINKISPDFLEQVSKKELSAHKFNELVKGVARIYQFASSVSIPPILDPTNRILKNCPLLFTKGDRQVDFFDTLSASHGNIIVSSFEKRKNLDNAIIGVYTLNFDDHIQGLVMTQLLDLEHYNGNKEQILNNTDMFRLKKLPKFKAESNVWYASLL
ncbi:hypothetical protein ACJOXM_11495 [Acinetobacter baumannii]